MPQYLIGIDAGTSVIKSVLFDTSGNEIGRATSPTHIIRSQPGWAEQDMYQLKEQVIDTLARLVRSYPEQTQRTVAIGVSAQGDGTWLLDKTKAPLRPAILWLDARCAPIVERWQLDGTDEVLFNRTGTAPCVSLQNVQLRWLTENDTHTEKEAGYVIHAGDWLYFFLTGNLTAELSQVGHTYFDRADESFSEQAFVDAGIESWIDRIPPLRNAFSSYDTLTTNIVKKTGLPSNTPVVGPLFDVCAASIGMGAIQNGDVCSILGSAGIHQMILDKPANDPYNVGYNIIMGPKQRWVRMLSSMTGTLNLDWFLNEIGLPSTQKDESNPFVIAESIVHQTEPGAKGLIYLPFIDPAGERAPFVNAHARASWFGLHTGLGKHHMLRALYEGIAMAARHCYEHMPHQFNHVFVAGGGARSDVWMQILADVTNKSVRRMESEETGALGAALMAGTVTNVYGTLDEALEHAVRYRPAIEPNTHMKDLYDAVFYRYKKLLQAIHPLWTSERSS